VPVNKPDNVDSFMEQINKIRSDKKMGLNLLLEEIERDISKQEQFIKE
jgi:hypothetical protein